MENQSSGSLPSVFWNSATEDQSPKRVDIRQEEANVGFFLDQTAVYQG
jgi:hypothetical protein